TWEFDGGSWTQKTPVHSPPPSAQHAMAYDPIRHTVLLFGGMQAGVVSNQLWEWNGADWQALPVSGGPSGRSGHMMTTDSARNRVILFGGVGGSGNLNDLWEWDGANWKQLRMGASPPDSGVSPTARSHAAFTFDEFTGKSILFAGFSTV